MSATSSGQSGPLLTEERAGLRPRELGWTRADTVRTVIAVSIALALLAVAAYLYNASGDSGVGPTASFSLLAGTALGILFERGRFCFYCISRDLFEKKDSRGAYSIIAALAAGTVGYALIFSIRLADPTTGRLPAGAHVAPVSIALVLAGLAFGLGVVISGGYIAGHIYRLGEGSLRAIPGLVGVVIGFGIGFLSWNSMYRLFIRDAATPWLPTGYGYGIAVILQLAVLAGIAAVLLRRNPAQKPRPETTITLTEIRRQVFFKRWPALLTGGLVGLVGVAAYLRYRPLGVTSQLSSATRSVMDSHDLLPSTLLGIDQTLAGCVALVVETITNNGWLVIGIFLGAVVAALPGRRFSIEPVTVRQGGTALVGGILLGWGAIIGLGCSIGTFLSGTQAMALSGWVFAISMVVALAVGFKLNLHKS